MDYLKIGYITKPHGLRGEIKVLPLTDNVGRYKKLSSVYLFIKNEYIQEEIESVRKSNNSLILKLKNYNSIEEVEKLRSIYLYINKEEGVPLHKDEFYTQDLIGCIMYFEGIKLGEILYVQNTGSCDICIVKYNSKEIWYPLLKQYVDEVDIENKKIIINQFEGFFD